MGAGLTAGALAGIGLLVIRADAAVLWHGMLEDGWPFVVSSAIAGAVALGATYRGRERVARAAAAVAVASVIAGWGVAQWPYLIVPDLTAAEAAAPKSSLGPIVIGLVVGAALVAPSLLLLFRVFKASQGAGRVTERRAVLDVQLVRARTSACGPRGRGPRGRRDPRRRPPERSSSA